MTSYEDRITSWGHARACKKPLETIIRDRYLRAEVKVQSSRSCPINRARARARVTSVEKVTFLCGSARSNATEEIGFGLRPVFSTMSLQLSARSDARLVLCRRKKLPVFLMDEVKEKRDLDERAYIFINLEFTRWD